MIIKTVKAISRFPTSMLPHPFQSTISIKTRIMRRLCTFLDENDCRFYYVYYFDNEEKEVIKAQKELERPPKGLSTGIIFGVIADIVLMGMAIPLLWKLLTTIYDRREFAGFEMNA